MTPPTAISFIDNNGRHYVRPGDVAYAFTMDRSANNPSVVGQRDYYLTIEYHSGRLLSFVFNREPVRDRIRQEIFPDTDVRTL